MRIECKILEGNTALRRTFRKIPSSVFVSMYSLEYTDIMDVLEKHRPGFKKWIFDTFLNYRIQFLIAPLYRGDVLTDSFILENEVLIHIGDNIIRTKLFFMDDKDDYRLTDVFNPRSYDGRDYEEFLKSESKGKGLCLMDCFHKITETIDGFEHGRATDEYALQLMEDMKPKGGK